MQQWLPMDGASVFWILGGNKNKCVN